jgi:hypothetical protein
VREFVKPQKSRRRPSKKSTMALISMDWMDTACMIDYRYKQ